MMKRRHGKTKKHKWIKRYDKLPAHLIQHPASKTNTMDLIHRGHTPIHAAAGGPSGPFNRHPKI